MAASSGLLSALPAREGHFRLESGYHTDLWLSLDALFVDPPAVAPLVDALAGRLRPHTPSAICGSLLGGAFLAQALAGVIGVRFCFTEPCPSQGEGLLTAAYRLPAALERYVRGEPVAVVDDVISVGSSARATVAAVRAAGGRPAVVGALMTLGDAAVTHFAREGIPLERLAARAFNLWKPSDCPMCAAGRQLEAAPR